MQTLASDVADLARDVCAFLMYVQKSSGDDFFRMVGELELSLSQLKLLMILDRDGERSLTELAEALVLSLPAASRAVEGLHKRGMAVRRAGDEDRRPNSGALPARGAGGVGRPPPPPFSGTGQLVEGLST